MKTIPVSELIEIDSTYLDKIKERKIVMDKYPDLVLGAHPKATASVEEAYLWLLSTYLPRRFPSMFEICSMNDQTGSMTHLRNLVTNEAFPLQPPTAPCEALRVMGALVDEDMMFMLPSDDEDGYCLRAFVNCFANGPDTRRRLEMKLRDIHGAVPGYQDHLAQRIDNWFDSLEVGKIVMRANVSVRKIRQLVHADRSFSGS